jgi:hypothetical protein
MSSVYRLLCLSHDPAIALDRELDRDEAEAVTRAHSALSAHPGCDVVVGRYSYPLVEVACLGIQLEGNGGCTGYHRTANWTDKGQLKLLAAAYATPSISADTLAPFTCWPAARLRRIYGELGIVDLRPCPACNGSGSAS